MSKLAFEHAITCSCDQFDIFGKYQNYWNRIFSPYQFLKGTDRFSEELNFYENRGTKLNRIEVSNAQGKSHACMTKKWSNKQLCNRWINVLPKETKTKNKKTKKEMKNKKRKGKMKHKKGIKN